MLLQATENKNCALELDNRKLTEAVAALSASNGELEAELAHIKEDLNSVTMAL